MANGPIHVTAMTKGDYDRFVKKHGRSPLESPRNVKPQSRIANGNARRKGA